MMYKRVANSILRFRNPKLQGLNYWDKLRALRLYSQERRRDRYAVIFIWKISQGLVEGYTIPFTCRDTRTGRKAEPSPVLQTAPGPVKKAKSASLAVRGSQMFNLLPVNLRNSEHGDWRCCNVQELFGHLSCQHP